MAVLCPNCHSKCKVVDRWGSTVTVRCTSSPPCTSDDPYEFDVSAAEVDDD